MNQANAVSLSTVKKFTLSEVADAFFVSYKGRDSSLFARIGFWASELGDLPIIDLNEDLVDLPLHALSKGKAIGYKGGAVAGGGFPPLSRTHLVS